MALKKLIYFQIWGSKIEYANMLRMCINSIRCHHENDNIDMMVICDTHAWPNISNLEVKLYLVTQPPLTYGPYEKLRIMSLTNLSEYDKVIYLDNDIVVSGDLNPLFDVIEKPNVLYVASTGDFDGHTNEWNSSKIAPHSDTTLQNLIKNEIWPFNVGQFGFIPSKKMKEHLDNCYELRNSKFYEHEQMTMNTYFCTRNITDYGLTKFVKFQPTWEHAPYENFLVTHFIGMHTNANTKLELMKDYFRSIILPDIKFAVSDEPIVKDYRPFTGLFDGPRGWVMGENIPWDDQFLNIICSYGLRIWWSTPDRSKFLIRI